MTEYTQLKFENDNNFDILLIKYCDINSISWLDSNYLQKLIDLDIYKVINTNSTKFLEDLSDNLEINKHNECCNLQVHTQLVAEFPTFIYELIYFVVFDKNNKLKQTKELLNGIGSLLNTNDDQIFGNAILMKTYLPTLSKEMIVRDTNTSSIKEILDYRVNTKIVTYDCEWQEKIVKGNLEEFAKEFFDDTYLKIEIPFLMHNINIWYDTLSVNKKDNNICGKLIDKPINKCIWFTMLSDDFRGSLTLDEVNKIIKLSHTMEFPYNVNKKWVEEENDLLDRKIIKNKYRILDLAYSLI